MQTVVIKILLEGHETGGNIVVMVAPRKRGPRYDLFTGQRLTNLHQTPGRSLDMRQLQVAQAAAYTWTTQYPPLIATSTLEIDALRVMGCASMRCARRLEGDCSA